MIIREFTLGDRDQIIVLMHEFGRYIEELDPRGSVEYASGGAIYFTDKLIKETSENSGQIYVAEAEDKIIGFIGGYKGKQDEEELREVKKVDLGVISEFFVTQTSRHTGIGSQLLAQMETWLKSQGCTLLRLGVFGPNSMARDFYRKHGYQERTVLVSKEI